MKRPLRIRIIAVLVAPALVALAGCAGGSVSANPGNTVFSISPGMNAIDTNCTGCNAVGPQGGAVEQFAATLAGGGAAEVVWSLSGGDAVSGPGTISATGQYAPPSYLTADRVQVVVTATLASFITASAVVTITPGFLQPLTPENAALGANGTLTITGLLAEAGGNTGINFAVSNSASGSGTGPGSLSATNCQRSSQAFTSCTVTYSAPALVPTTAVTHIVATVGASSSRTEAQLLLNPAGLSSNPAAHQAQMPMAVQLGSSGGNNRDYDATGNTVQDCCGGTLGSLIEDSLGRQYLLSNNHVLARSDHASQGDAVVQPGLIDNNCTPNGEGPGTTPVATLTGWLPLKSSQTNANAAIALVASHAVDPNGSILELGARQPDGTLSAAPPGVSSTGGKGEAASLRLTVAKSGRTTGLTCGSVSALSLDVKVDYFQDCAETKPFLTKTFSNQVAISGNQFSDAGDSGSLVVDAGNAEPVGLFFAGGIDSLGAGQGVASPASDVLAELSAQVGGGAAYRFVGGADHAVSCLSYGDNAISGAQSSTLSDVEIARAQQALAEARMLVNPAAGVLGVGIGKSNDHPGEAALTAYVDEGMNVNVPATIKGVRTLVIPTNARAVASGAAPQTAFEAASVPALSASVLSAALAVKQKSAQNLMKRAPAFFGVGVGQSLDNPKEAVLVIYVDRRLIPAQLPQTLDGLRTRFIVMDRLHVTRSYLAPARANLHCFPRPPANRPESFNWLGQFKPRSLKLD